MSAANSVVSWAEPSRESILRRMEDHKHTPFSYPEVGGTSGKLQIRDYTVDRSSIRLGHGAATFQSARKLLRAWSGFDLPWVRLVAEGAPHADQVVGVVARAVGLWFVNLNRIHTVVDEEQCWGFTYGTLPLHVEQGEERFQLEHDPRTNEVHYRIEAFSRPVHPLARWARPLSRRAQRRFARGSLERLHAEVRDEANGNG